MEYSFVSVVFVVVVITACAQWAVALLELRKHSATREENMKKNMRKRVRAHLCYFNYFICAELQRKGVSGWKRGGERKRGNREGRVKQQFSLRWLFACNLPVQIVQLTIATRNWNVHSLSSPSLCPFTHFLYSPFCFIWLDFILFHSLFILFHFIACGLCKQIPLSACWCCNWFVSVSVFVFIFKAFAKVDNLLNAQVTAITVN